MTLANVSGTSWTLIDGAMAKPSLKWKVSLYLSLTLAVVIFLFASLMIRNQREELFDQAVSHANQLAEVVIKSTRFAMLQNQPSQIDQIIRDVAEQEDIDRVRVISKDGTVIHSSVTAEVGQVIKEFVINRAGILVSAQEFQLQPSGKPVLFLLTLFIYAVFCQTLLLFFLFPEGMFSEHHDF